MGSHEIWIKNHHQQRVEEDVAPMVVYLPSMQEFPGAIRPAPPKTGR